MIIEQKLWTAVDLYFNALFAPPDPILDTTLQTADEAGLPAIQVAPNQGKLLAILAQAIGARAILEIGTLGGYSTIWLGRVLPPGGKLISLEADPKHAEVARANIIHAGLKNVVEIRVGRALDTLPKVASEQRTPFDLVFIDADKTNYPAYLDWAVKLTRRGGLIIADNVVRDGEVIKTDHHDPNVQGVRRFNAALAADPRLSATGIQTVGAKGYDGFAIALVTGDQA